MVPEWYRNGPRFRKKSALLRWPPIRVVSLRNPIHPQVNLVGMFLTVIPRDIYIREASPVGPLHGSRGRDRGATATRLGRGVTVLPDAGGAAFLNEVIYGSELAARFLKAYAL